MCSLDPTRSKLALTRVRFDAEGLQVLPLSNQSEERRGDSQHFSEIPHYFLCAVQEYTVSQSGESGARLLCLTDMADMMPMPSQPVRKTQPVSV